MSSQMARPRPKQQSQQDGINNQSSSNLTLHNVNPWEQESESVTHIRKALILAEHMKINTMDDESVLVSRLADLPSCQMLSIQKDITSKRKALFEVKKKSAICLQEKETSDLMHLGSIESRINMIKQLCSDLNSVLKNKDKLIKSLQTPFVGDFLKIEASFHGHVCDTFNLLVSTLNEVSHHLDNMIWISNQDMASSHCEPLVAEVQSLTASLQTSYQTLQQMRKGMKQLRNNAQQSSPKSEVMSPSRVSSLSHKR